MAERKESAKNSVLPGTIDKLIGFGNTLELAIQAAQDARQGLPNGLTYSLLAEIEHGLHSDVKSLWRVINLLKETGSDSEVLPDAKPAP